MPHNFFSSCCLAGILLPVISLAQKGIPAPVITKATVHTNYAQVEDFKPALLSRLKVPAGFKVSIAASGLGKPRMLHLNADGSLYVTRRDQGDVLLLRDTDNDGMYDDMKPVVVKFKGVHGIAVRNKELYLTSNRELKRYTIKDDYTVSDTTLIFQDLPDGGQHGNRTMHFGPDGKLYLSVGSDCNDCQPTNPEHATLLQLDVDRMTRRIYARGLRNTIGFDWHPNTAELWGPDNGSDMKGDDLPPEELNKIKDNGHYGWPLIYGKQVVDESREDPPGGTKAAFAKTTEPSIMDFPAHAAPIDFKFLSKAASFPADYKDDALVCWHGSWNKLKPDGFKVQRIKFENGKPVGTEDFLSGFLSTDGKTRFGRPAGIAVSAKGIVYISDDASGNIYAISRN